MAQGALWVGASGFKHLRDFGGFRAERSLGV